MYQYKIHHSLVAVEKIIHHFIFVINKLSDNFNNMYAMLKGEIKMLISNSAYYSHLIVILLVNYTMQISKAISQNMAVAIPS